MHDDTRRERLPDERRSITHQFKIEGVKVYLTVGLYPDGRQGEMFMVMAKEGSTMSGLLDAFAKMFSLALQYGVPIDVIIGKLKDLRFEPFGTTSNREISEAKSIMDYIARWLEKKFV